MADYSTLALNCRTTNEFNRLHIDLEERLAPLALARIDLLRKNEKLHPASHAWLEKLRNLEPAIFQRPQQYKRRKLSVGAALYADPGRPACQKQLLVAFTGVARRLMLPLAVFLQSVDSSRWDVAVLWRIPRPKSDIDGIEGMSPDLSGILANLGSAVGLSKYRAVTTIGSSGGGYAAILAAIHLDARRGISIGGSLPKTLAVSSHDKARARRSTRELFYVFGEGHVVDRISAVAMQEIFGGNLRPVPHVEGHNVLFPLVQLGTFTSFMDDLLPGEPPRSFSVWVRDRPFLRASK